MPETPTTDAATPPGAPAVAERGQHAPTHREIVTILSGLMLGMFLAALDQTIVATSIRTIGDDLHGLSVQAWVTTAYLLTSTISTPLYGKLSDMYGRKPFYLGAISLFVIGSLLSGTANSMYQLAAYRGLQGLGAGGLMSLAITILGDLVAPRERAKYQAYFLAVFGTSSVLGPVIGGFFAGADSILGIDGWRWVFLVNVPIGVLAFIVISRVLHLPKLHGTKRRIDWWGAVTLVVGLVPLLIVAEQGRTWGWTSPGSMASYVVGVLGIIAFLLVESRMGEDALLPLVLFRGKVFTLGAVANLVLGIGMFGALATLPLYLQIVRGMSPTAAGLALIPFTIGIMSGSLVAGQLTARTGRYKIFPIIGTSLLVVGAALLSRVGADSSMVGVYGPSTIFGLGLGLTMQPLILAVQNAVEAKDMGVATSASLFFRQVGGTLGTAVFLSILFSTVEQNIASAFTSAAKTPDFQAALADPAVVGSPDNAPIVKALTGGGAFPSLDDSSFINKLDDRLAAPILHGFTQSIDLVLLTAAIILVLGVVTVVLLPEVPLRTTSGIQGQMDAKAAADASEAEAAGLTTAGVETAVVDGVLTTASEAHGEGETATHGKATPGGEAEQR